MDPEAVQDLLTRQGSGVTPDEYDDLNETDEVIEERTKALVKVLSTCQALWDNGSENAKTEELAVIAQKLGDGSRDGESHLQQHKKRKKKKKKRKKKANPGL